MSPLKVFILGVPMCRSNVGVVINCPMSDPAGAGHGACWGGPEGTLPPAGCSAARVGCLSGPYLPLPRKVTSWSSSLSSLLPNGHAHSLGGGLLGGTFILHCVISWCNSSMSYCSSWSARSPRSTCRWCGVPLLGGVHWGGV